MMLKEFGKNIWVVEGNCVGVAGFNYPTRMVVIKLSDQTLFIWSPIELTTDLKSQVDLLGDVMHIIAPNSLHHLFVSQWQAAYPIAKLYAAPKLQEKRNDISFTKELSDTSFDNWEGDVEKVLFKGNIITTEVVFFHKASRTVLFTDLLQQFPEHYFSGWRGIIAKLDLMTCDRPTVPRKFRLATLKRNVARNALARILEWPSEKVIMAHGTPVTEKGKAFLKFAFTWLSKNT